MSVPQNITYDPSKGHLFGSVQRSSQEQQNYWETWAINKFFDSELNLAEAISQSDMQRWIIGSNSYAGFRSGRSSEPLSIRLLAGVVEYHPADMVITVRAGTSLDELQKELAKNGQCLPLFRAEGFPGGTVGGGISMAMPHPLESKWGSWRDWVLGLKLLLADGTVVKCGSRAVKNVAGYDIQKLIVGARGSLAIILEATLRVAPISALDALPDSVTVGKLGALKCVQRVLRTDFAQALELSREMVLFACSETGTLWQAGEPLQRFESDWIMNSGHGDANVEIHGQAQIRLMLKAKTIFDPTNKLNPREWEFV